MSNFLLGDSMDDVESSDNLTHAQTIMQIFYFVVETLQKEATNQGKFPIQYKPGEFSNSKSHLTVRILFGNLSKEFRYSKCSSGTSFGAEG